MRKTGRRGGGRGRGGGGGGGGGEGKEDVVVRISINVKAYIRERAKRLVMNINDFNLKNIEEIH